MQDASSHVSRHGSASIPPLAIDASPEASGDRGPLADIDARALTSLAALFLAMTVVCVIAIIGHLKHAGNASATQDSTDSTPPLVNLGVEIPAPAINVGRPTSEQ